MRRIKQIRETFDMITEKEETDFRKLTSLVRAGLFDAKKLPLIKRALEKDVNKLTPAERKVLLQLLDSLMSEVLSSQQVHTKVRQNVMTKEEYIEESRKDYYTKFDPRFKKNPKVLPNIIILKRKAMRIYPDNQVIGLYYSQTLDRYISIPFDTGGKTKHISSSVLSENTNIDDDEKEKKKLKVRTTRSVPKKLKPDEAEKSREEKLANAPLSSLTTDRNRKKVRKLAVRQAGSSLASGDVGGALGAIGFAAGSFARRKGVRNPEPVKNKANTPKPANSNDASVARRANPTNNVVRFVKRGSQSSTIKESFRNRLNEKREALDEALPLIPLAIGIGGAKLAGKAAAALAARRATQELARRGASGAARSKARTPLETPVVRGPRPVRKPDDKPADKPAPQTKPADKPAPAPAPAKPAPQPTPAKPAQPAPQTRPDGKTGDKPQTQTQPGAKPDAATKPSRLSRFRNSLRNLGRAGRRGGIPPIGLGSADEPKYAQVDIDPKKAKTSKATGFDPNVARTKQDVTLNRKLIQNVNENVNINSLEKISINESLNVKLKDGTEVGINRNVAEKIINLHETLNSKNRITMLSLMNENYNSFKKIVDFAAKQ